MSVRHLPSRVFAGLGLLLWALSVTAQTPEAPFAVETAELRLLPEERVFDARVEAVRESTVSTQTSGRIIEINFDVDDLVEQGEVIVRIRDREQRAAVASAEARFREAQAEFERVRDLLQKNLIARAAFDRAEADLEAARASRDLAREQLEHTVVRAPYSGIVTERHVELGETANLGQPLMTGFSLDALRLVVTVPQEAITAVRQHSHARVLLRDGRELIVEQLTFFPYADPSSHTFRVRVPLPEGLDGVYPGMFAKVAFQTGEAERLVVPREAVAHRSEVTAVYVVDDAGDVRLRHVRTGRVLNGLVEVLAGLQPGERVALDPVAAAIFYKERAEARHD